MIKATEKIYEIIDNVLYGTGRTLVWWGDDNY